MRLKSSHLVSLSRFTIRQVRHLLPKTIPRKLVCFAVALNLLLWPGPSLFTRDFLAVALQALDMRVGLVSYEARLLRWLFGSLAPSPQAETTETRSDRVRSITISPAKRVGYLDQRLSFSAVGKDALGNIAQGAKISWSSSDTSKAQIDDSGQATVTGPGLVWVTAATRFASARAPVLIRPIARPLQNDSEWQLDQDQLKLDGAGGATTGGVRALVDSLMAKLAPTAHAQTGGGDSGDLLYDELWSEPRNLVGSPRNRVTDASMIGTVLPEGSNFEFSIPIESLPGRGLPLNVSAHYNSRSVWSRRTNKVTFNAVNTWPYLGFTLGSGASSATGPTLALN